MRGSVRVRAGVRPRPGLALSQRGAVCSRVRLHAPMGSCGVTCPEGGMWVDMPQRGHVELRAVPRGAVSEAPMRRARPCPCSIQRHEHRESIGGEEERRGGGGLLGLGHAPCRDTQWPLKTVKALQPSSSSNATKRGALHQHEGVLPPSSSSNATTLVTVPCFTSLFFFFLFSLCVSSKHFCCSTI